ncbi:cytoskeletal protein binding protein, partial [Tulasnella sp. 417]
MLKIWIDVWTSLVRQLFIRQKLEALNNSQRNSITAPEVAQVDAEPVTVAPSSRSVSSRKVAGGAEIIPNSNPNRHRTHGQPVLPPAIEVVDERDLRVSRHSLRSVRKSAGQYPPTRLAVKDSKPLPPLPGSTQTNPNLLTVPYTNTRRPARPRLSRTSTVITLRSSKVSGRLSTMAEEVVFRDVMKASYDYAATADDELTMKEDQLLYLLGNLDDDWAKVQVHTALEALSEAEPAAGLVPSAYIEPAPPLYRAFALYDYEPNGEGEIFMKENEKMSVYLKEDDWILVKIDRKGTVSKSAIGYVPANYVEEGEGDGEAPAQEEVPVPAAAVPIPPTPGTPTAQADNAERAAAAAAKLKGDPVDIWN